MLKNNYNLFHCLPNVIETSKKRQQNFQLTVVALGGWGEAKMESCHTFLCFFNPSHWVNIFLSCLHSEPSQKKNEIKQPVIKILYFTVLGHLLISRWFFSFLQLLQFGHIWAGNKTSKIITKLSMATFYILTVAMVTILMVFHLSSSSPPQSLYHSSSSSGHAKKTGGRK